MEYVVRAISRVISALEEFSYFIYDLAMYCLGYFTALFSLMFVKLFVLFIDIYDYLISDLLASVDALYNYAGITPAINAFNVFVTNPDYVYYSSMFQFSMIFKTIVTAYLIRFAIRRLPFVG